MKPRRAKGERVSPEKNSRTVLYLTPRSLVALSFLERHYAARGKIVSRAIELLLSMECKSGALSAQEITDDIREILLQSLGPMKRRTRFIKPTIVPLLQEDSEEPAEENTALATRPSDLRPEEASDG